MKRLLVLVSVVVIAIVAFDQYGKYSVPYGTGELDEIRIQYCDMDSFRVVIRDSARIEAIRSMLKLEEDPEIYLVDYCMELVFVGRGFEDMALINSATIWLGETGETRVGYSTPAGLAELAWSYRDSSCCLESWESPYLKWKSRQTNMGK